MSGARAGGRWRRAAAIAGVAPALLVAGFAGGPPVLHAAHRAGTPADERARHRERYAELWRLGGGTAAPEQRVAIREERRAIFLWFHARGWNLDEGWHEGPVARRRRQWRELFEYWRR